VENQAHDLTTRIYFLLFEINSLGLRSCGTNINRGEPYEREFSFPRLIVVPLSSHAVDGVRKEKERLTAAEAWRLNSFILFLSHLSTAMIWKEETVRVDR
jgi:hypothetical protein